MVLHIIYPQTSQHRCRTAFDAAQSVASITSAPWPFTAKGRFSFQESRHDVV